MSATDKRDPGSPDTLGGPLILSGGGNTLVATDTLLVEAAQLGLLHVRVTDWLAQLAHIQSLESGLAPSWTGANAGPELLAASEVLGGVEAHSRDLAARLTTAAENYGWAERAAQQVSSRVGALGGHFLGRFGAAVLMTLAGPAALVGLVGWLLGGRDPAGPHGVTAQKTPSEPGDPRLARVLREPAFVAVVRVLAGSADDIALGAVGVPLPLAAMVGDGELGVTGVSTTAAGVLAAARLRGMLRESGVQVTRVGAGESAGPPAGVEDLAARIPRATRDEPQVRIERYGEPPTWIVYIGGTVDWTLTGSSDPWDLTSDLSAIAERDPGSTRALLQMMHEAGIRPGDPVAAVGHSQGGVIASQLAASGAFNTVAVATFGAPETPGPVPAGVPTLVVEHVDDLVTAVGGTVAVASADRLVVRREAFAAADEASVGEVLPAHNVAVYEDTARRIDASAEPRLQEFRATLATLVGAEPGTATRWRGIRSPNAVAEIAGSAGAAGAPGATSAR